MPSPLEDDLCDVLGKAARGLGWSETMLATRAGLTPRDVRSALAERPQSPVTDETLTRLARVLGLDAPSLRALRDEAYRPVVALPDEVVRIESCFGTMRVNNYVLGRQGESTALLIDTGADLGALDHVLDSRAWRPTHLLLTHDHPDHVALIDALREAWPEMEVCAPDLDPVAGARLLSPPCTVGLAGWQVRCLPTPGHTDGCTSYLMDTPTAPVCFVGDALFAGSIGGPRFSYAAAREALESQILPLPAETILCPGHGPPTTIRLESEHNPFLVTMVPPTHSNIS